MPEANVDSVSISLRHDLVALGCRRLGDGCSRIKSVLIKIVFCNGFFSACRKRHGDQDLLPVLPALFVFYLRVKFDEKSTHPTLTRKI
jgi:hypothetical protein